MEYLNLEREKTNNFSLSRIGLGGMRMSADSQDSINTIHAALDAGINYLNTADFYSGGANEMTIGNALKTRKREDVFIAVKFGGLISPDGKFYGMDARPETVQSYLTYTLKRLGTEYVDLYQPARINPHIPVEDTIGAIAEMVKKGYVKSVGISEVDGETLRRAHAVHPISLAEVRYSLMDRHIEDDLLPVARELGVGIVAFGVLLAGLIGGSSSDEKLAMVSQRVSVSTMENVTENLARAAGLKAIAEEKGITLAQLAIAWVLAQGEDILALVGSRTIAQVQSTVKASDIRLTANDLQRIETIIPKHTAKSSYMLEATMDEKGIFKQA